MGDGPIQPVIQSITIDTMLNNIRLNIGDRLNFVTYEQGLNPPNCWRAAVFKHFKNSEVDMNDD